MIYEMNLEPAPFEATMRGEKKIEVRLNDEKRRALKIGDSILFKNTLNDEFLRTEVIGVRIYKTLDDLVTHEDIRDTGGIYKDSTDWIRNLNRYYSSELQARWGLIAIAIKLR